MTRIKKCCIFAALINQNSSYMETTNNNLEITSVSLFTMDNLSVGDIFLFTADGPKYVFLGRTPDGKFSYMRTDNKRKFYSHRNRYVFNMDVNGGLFICNGELFVNYQSAMICATRL